MSPLQKVDIFIGQDNAEALVPIDVLRGKKNEPFNNNNNNIYLKSNIQCI